MEFSFAAWIESVRVKVKDVDGHLLRLMEMKFASMFEGSLAAALKGDAATALAGLKNFGMEQVVLPLDALDVTADLVAGDDRGRVTVEQMKGVKAVCKAGDPEDGSAPSIEFHFTTLWTEDVWIFLGRFTGAYVQLTLIDRQMSLPLPVPTEAKGKRASS